MKKRALYSIMALVLVLGLALSAATLVSAAALVNIELDPTPPCYILNDGVQVQGFRWTIEFDSVPDYYTFQVRTYPGLVLIDTPETNFSVDITGQSSPVHNDEWTGSHIWNVPAGQPAGQYRAQVTYYSTTGGYEADAGRIFEIRQRVQVYKYNDLNGNGINDAGEPPLSGWEFSVSGPETFSGTTDGTGFAIFQSLNPTFPCDSGPQSYRDVLASGIYTVTETLKSGWSSTDPGGSAPYQKGFTVPDPAGETIVIEFGNQGLGDLIIFKYHDKDYSHTYNAGDTPLADWDFNVEGLGIYTTNASGLITINDIPAGDYDVTEVTPLPTGWICTDPGGSAPYMKLATVPAGGSVQVNFGNKPMGELKIFKYHDKDKSGTYNLGDTPLQGWEFTVSGLPGSYFTDVNGLITINTNAGNYTVTEKSPLPLGWICTDPGGVAPYQKIATVPVGGSVQVNFGNSAPPTCLTICKFEDANVNGMWDPGEEYLPDWRFEVTGPDNFDTWVTTGPEGCVVLDGLVSGTYTVTEELEAGWYNTRPGGDPPYEQEVNVEGGGECARVEFGNREEIRDLPPNIPTLDKWGIIAMIILFTGLIVWTVRRKRLGS